MNELQQSTRPRLGYALEQRLRLIDFLLFHYGYVKREAVMDYFGVSPACVTRDFGQYLDIAPANMALNPSEHIYYRTVAFARVWA